jgi:ParB-like chromosome segregation protein Spo0J
MNPRPADASGTAAAVHESTNRAGVPVTRLLPIFDLILEDATRLSRDEEHINALQADYEQRLTEHPGEHPVQTPLRVVRRGDKWLIIAGAYRYLAGLRACLKHMPCIALDRELDEAEKLIEQAKDNQLHKPYTPIEQARNIVELKRLRPDLSYGEAGRLLGIAAPYTAKRLKVLNDYPADLHVLIGEGPGFVPFTAAYHLARLKDEQAIRDLTDKVVRGQLSRDAVTEAVTKLLGGKGQKKPKPVKVQDGGGSASFPGDWGWDRIIEWYTHGLEAAKRGAKIPNAPTAYLPRLLKPA